MNRPIDWKKISELKRQAAPLPEVPLGDMLSELLESETAMPAWDAPMALAALPVTAVEELASAPALETSIPEVAVMEIPVMPAAEIVTITVVEPVTAAAEVEAETITTPPPVIAAEQTIAPAEWDIPPVAIQPVAVPPAARQFEAEDSHFTVTPNLVIHSKVEMALSELSESASRYESIDTTPPAEFQPPVQLEAEATVAAPPLVERFEVSAAESVETAAPEQSENLGLQPVQPESFVPKPASIHSAIPLAPPARFQPPQPAAQVDSLLAMLLGSDKSQNAVPVPKLEAQATEAPIAALMPAASSAPPPKQAAPPADVLPLPSPTAELDDLISAMDREVERSPFEEKTGDSTPLTAENPLSRESCLVFSLAGVKFGIPIHQVVELDKLPRVTRVPNVPYWVRGVTNLRGEILSVLDLRLLMGMERHEHLDRGRILVVRIGEDSTAALVVDEVSGIARYVQDQLAPPSADESPRIISLLDGIYSTEELALKVLNVDKLMATPELRQLEAA